MRVRQQRETESSNIIRNQMERLPVSFAHPAVYFYFSMDYFFVDIARFYFIFILFLLHSNCKHHSHAICSKHSKYNTENSVVVWLEKKLYFRSLCCVKIKNCKLHTYTWSENRILLEKAHSQRVCVTTAKGRESSNRKRLSATTSETLMHVLQVGE